LQPFSFYLGGKRTYHGLPNNPNYELGPLAGSICDTLTAIDEHHATKEFSVYPNPAQSECTVEYDGRTPALLSICDMQGRKLRSRYLPMGQEKYLVNLSGLEPAIYLVIIENDNDEKITNRLVIMK
jgi:hypothetical protein